MIRIKINAVEGESHQYQLGNKGTVAHVLHNIGCGLDSWKINS
jgi:hypothetical protein